MNLICSAFRYCQHYRGLSFVVALCCQSWILANISCMEISQQEGALVLIIWKCSTQLLKTLQIMQPDLIASVRKMLMHESGFLEGLKFQKDSNWQNFPKTIAVKSVGNGFFNKYHKPSIYISDLTRKKVFLIKKVFKIHALKYLMQSILFLH